MLVKRSAMLRARGCGLTALDFTEHGLFTSPVGRAVRHGVAVRCWVSVRWVPPRPGEQPCFRVFLVSSVFVYCLWQQVRWTGESQRKDSYLGLIREMDARYEHLNCCAPISSIHNRLKANPRCKPQRRCHPVPSWDNFWVTELEVREVVSSISELTVQPVEIIFFLHAWRRYACREARVTLIELNRRLGPRGTRTNGPNEPNQKRTKNEPHQNTTNPTNNQQGPGSHHRRTENLWQNDLESSETGR